MSPIRLGLIGVGRWGRNIIRTIEELDGIEVVRVASLDPAAASLICGNCVVTADWREVATATDLDGVIIATPAVRHAEMAALAIDANQSLLIEKPLALHIADAEALLAATEGRRLVAMVDHVLLHSTAWAELKWHLLSLGDIRHIHSVGGNFGPCHGDVPALWDYGSHDMALCLDLLGVDPVAVRAKLVEARRESEGAGEIVRDVLTFPCGVEAVVTVGNLVVPKTVVLRSRRSGAG